MVGIWRTALFGLALAQALALALAQALALALALACSSGGPAQVEPNPVRRALESDLAGLDLKAPLELRYNPAPCDCPPFELHAGRRWVRAELGAAEPDKLARWIAWLAQTPLDALPVAVQVRGKPDRDVVRTAQGSYAVRLEVLEIVAPSLPGELAPPDTEVQPPLPETGLVPAPDP